MFFPPIYPEVVCECTFSTDVSPPSRTDGFGESVRRACPPLRSLVDDSVGTLCLSSTDHHGGDPPKRDGFTMIVVRVPEE